MNTIAQIQESLRSRKISPTELFDESLRRIKADPLNSVLTVCEDRARQFAARAQVEWDKDSVGAIQRQPLLGVPLGIKDGLVVEGVRTTCASRILENYIPPYTATVVRRLEQAGAISIAKLNMDEFAMGGSNENSAFGAVAHPTHPGRVPGGSSGGSAAAVGAGLCVAALGSDTGGSVRLPASYCGVVGFKPTYGVLSRYGLVAFASSLDQVGPITRTVEDAAILMDAMAGHDPIDSTSIVQPQAAYAGSLKSTESISSLRLGVPAEYFSGGLQPEVERAVHDAIRWYEAKGARIIPVELPHTRYAVATYYLIAVSEASSNLARFDGVRYGVRPPSADASARLESFYSSTRSLFGPEVKRRILLGTYALSSGYYEAFYRRACQVRRKIQQDFERAFEKVDLIAGPVSATTAFKKGEKSGDPLQMYLNDIFTVPINLAGLPAVSLPCGKDSQNLPIGLQLVAPAFADERLLGWAAAFDRRSS